MKPIFITGIGTDVGKTVVAAIITEALKADYWKPVQAGLPTDSEWVKSVISNSKTTIHPEKYLLDFPASPHISARMERKNISVEDIVKDMPVSTNQLVIEGAGGLLVPLNDSERILNLIIELDARVVIVSKNYLGSINHSLLTAQILTDNKVDILGWVFNDHYLDYENDIVSWTKLPKIASIEKMDEVNKESIKMQANIMEGLIKRYL